MMTIDTCGLPLIDILERGECDHAPPCPAFWAPGRLAAKVVAFRPEQGWSLLCNGIVVFDDSAEPIVPTASPAIGGAPVPGSLRSAW